jgi:hypothetical protein
MITMEGIMIIKTTSIRPNTHNSLLGGKYE